MLKTVTLDLEDEAEQLRDQIGAIEGRQDQLADEAVGVERRADDGAIEEDERQDEVNRLDRSFSVLEARRVRLEGYLDAVESAIEEWDGTEIQMRELTGQAARLLRDDLQRKAKQMGMDEIPDGSHEIELVKETVVSMPPGAPDPGEVHGLPNRLFDWLHGRANALNTVGRFEVKNSSLRERMTERTSLTSPSQ